MKKLLFLLSVLISIHYLNAQTEPKAGKWKTWFISSGSEYRLPPPPDGATTKEEIKKIIAVQKNIDSPVLQKILYWNAGSPSYRWREIISDVARDYTAGENLSNLLLNVAIY